MRSQSWILHYLGYLCKFHRTLSRMQKASQSVGKTSKPDGRVIFTPKKWIKNQIYNPWTRSWDRSKTCRFLTLVKETSEHMRSPYSTPHIYGVERAISSLGVPFCRPSLTKRIAASGEEICVKHEIPLNFSTALMRSWLYQIHK